jgi:hypothetical protein
MRRAVVGEGGSEESKFVDDDDRKTNGSPDPIFFIPAAAHQVQLARPAGVA